MSKKEDQAPEWACDNLRKWADGRYAQVSSEYLGVLLALRRFLGLLLDVDGKEAAVFRKVKNCQYWVYNSGEVVVRYDYYLTGWVWIRVDDEMVWHPFGFFSVFDKPLGLTREDLGRVRKRVRNYFSQPVAPVMVFSVQPSSE